MTPQELEALLAGEDLLKVLDVRTLVLDTMRNLPDETMIELFYQQLSGLSETFVRDYLYIKR